MNTKPPPRLQRDRALSAFGDSVPSLDEMVNNPSLIEGFSRATRAQLYRLVARLEAELRSLLLVVPSPERGESFVDSTADTTLTISEAAELLRTSKDTLYRKWRRLNFAYKDPLDHQIKFSRAGIDKHIRRQLSRFRDNP